MILNLTYKQLDAAIHWTVVTVHIQPPPKDSETAGIRMICRLLDL